jgi:Asp-tRNA(Asn)/Glu-tRNA(Gln) amidotransferase A subunit family amidase
VAVVVTDELTLRSCSEHIAKKSLSCVELLQIVLDRIEATEPTMHAYVTVTPERAMEAARVLDAELARGTYRGPLHGIPIAVKDVICTTDAPTQAGSRVLAGYKSGADATSVRLLREAGAVLLGKVVTQEFALGHDIPKTRNSWGADHWPGGSSTGSAVAVSVGSALASLGTDSGGSVRIPSALNSVVGLKPTYGRISRRGVVASISSVDHVGIVARSVVDCATVLQAIAGFDAADHTSINEPVPSYLAGLERTVKGCRVGVPRSQFLDRGVDDEVRDAIARALSELERAGVKLVSVEIPFLELAREIGIVMAAAEAAAVHRKWLRDKPSHYGSGTRQFLTMGLAIPAVYVDAARGLRSLVVRGLRQTFEGLRLGAIALPTLPVATWTRESMLAADRSMKPLSARFRATAGAVWQNTLFANLSGLPALTVPCGFTSTNLPIGFQLIGRPFDEETLFRLGRSYQDVTDWHLRRPDWAPGD